MATSKKSGRSAAPRAAAQTDSKYKVLRNVTMPSVKLEMETPYYLKATGAYFTGRAQKAGKNGEVMEPATVLPVVNIETGEVGQLILGSVLKGLLDEAYPAEGYVGKAFRIVKHEKRPGKRYFTYSLDEIEA